MDFLFTLMIQYDPSRSMETIADEITRQTELARDGGYDGIRAGEHHVTDDKYLNLEPVLAYAAANAGEMSVTTGVTVLPYHHPVRVAEYAATMDVLTGGRFNLGVAQGYRKKEFEVFGVTDPATRVGRLCEGSEVIKHLWTEDDVSYEGDHFELSNVSINPKPLQDPRPPIWVGASNEKSIRRGAHFADGYWGSHVPFDKFGSLVEAFRDERADIGADDGYVGISREMFVGETDEAAERTVRDHLMHKYMSYSAWGQDDVIEEDEFTDKWEEIKEDRFIIGDPETVTAELKRYENELDVDFVATRMQYHNMDFEDVRSSLRLFCDEVIPSFQ